MTCRSPVPGFSRAQVREASRPFYEGPCQPPNCASSLFTLEASCSFPPLRSRVRNDPARWKAGRLRPGQPSIRFGEAENIMLHAPSAQGAGMTRKNNLRDRWVRHQGPARFPEHSVQTTSRYCSYFFDGQTRSLTGDGVGRLRSHGRSGRHEPLFHILPQCHQKFAG